MAQYDMPMPNTSLLPGLNALAAGLQQGQERRQRNALAELIPQAIGGDEAAKNRLYGLSPELGLKLDERQRSIATERKKEIKDYLSQEALGLAHLDEQQLQQAFPIAAQRWVQRYPELASQITPEYDQTVRPTIMGLAGVKPNLPEPIKPTSNMQEYELAKSQGFQGTIQDWILSQKKAAAPKTEVSVNTGQKGFENELKIRGDFRQEPTYKAFQETDSAYKQIQAALDQKSPAGDLAGATKIMKLLDPGSVVRESELGMAMAASGLLDRMTNYADKIIKGTKLTPTQREDFRKLADEFYSTAAESYNAKRGEYHQIATDYGMNADRVTGPAPTPRQAPKAPVQISGDADYAALPSGAQYIAPDGSLRRKK